MEISPIRNWVLSFGQMINRYQSRSFIIFYDILSTESSLKKDNMSLSENGLGKGPFSNGFSSISSCFQALGVGLSPLKPGFATIGWGFAMGKP